MFFLHFNKMLPDFIGLHCLGRPFAMPSTAFLSVNTFRFNGMFLSVASMMRNRGHWLSFWFVSLSSWFLSLDCVVGFEVEHGGDVLFCRFMLIMVWWGLELSIPPRLNTLSYDQKPISLKTHVSWPTPKIIQAPTAIQPQRDSLPLWHTAHQTRPGRQL